MSLTKRLRLSWDSDRSIISQTEKWMIERREAADRIEELEAENRDLREFKRHTEILQRQSERRVFEPVSAERLEKGYKTMTDIHHKINDAIKESFDLFAIEGLEECEEYIGDLERRSAAQLEAWNDAEKRAKELESRLAGVDAGTHVIVPVEPTLDMSIAWAETFYTKERCIDDHDISDWYSALIQAAKEAGE